jgi:hypothetical protein
VGTAIVPQRSDRRSKRQKENRRRFERERRVARTLDAEDEYSISNLNEKRVRAHHVPTIASVIAR